MLMAKTKNGKKVCLGYPFKKETLVALRQKEEFFCPICEERVILKLGERKIYHFSHKKGGNCRDFYENETEYHMEGKLRLYQWLRQQKVPAVLEFYDREIQQRPDILFYDNGRKYALEFQCSTISEQLFKKRTENYFSHGYTPLWIIGGNNLKEKLRTESLTNFHYLFLRRTKDGQLFIPSFSPDQNIITILYSIFPYSIKNVFLKKIANPIEKVKLAALLEPKLVPKLNVDQWISASAKYKLNWSVYPSVHQRRFFTEVYNNRLNFFLFPPEIGLPVPHGLYFQTPPFIWQAYYYLDVLRNKLPGEYISIQQIERSLAKRIKKNEIVPRQFPQIQKHKPLEAFIDYTRLLEKLGVLVKKMNNFYQVQRCLDIPLTNREKELLTLQFFTKNRQIFEKNK
ncbi:competence protein CoiA [Bacillus sp. EB600]|uniref:competence protein CoiA n=1 Tax=Bacillus sp. EB600 TaxID=2806345 RepID=UPI00210E9214|nr:competence protein CoiA family protein [Bacillus sp. EB600]